MNPRRPQKGIPFYKFSPGGNATLLVPGPAVPEARRAAVSAGLMNPLHLGAEQVGFVDLRGNPPGLAMMGGEFCGNACRCLAALLVMRMEAEPAAWPVSGVMRSSGATEPVAWRVNPCPDGASGLEAAVRVSLEAAVVSGLEPGVIRVDMPGIVHILLAEDRHPPPDDPVAEAAAWRDRLALSGHAAVGCIRHAPFESPVQRILPLVWVRGTDSSCLETACGSGSLALALALHDALGGGNGVRIRQPSGEDIVVELEREGGRVRHGWIGGPVRLVARGRAFLPEML